MERSNIRIYRNNYILLDRFFVAGEKKKRNGRSIQAKWLKISIYFSLSLTLTPFRTLFQILPSHILSHSFTPSFSRVFYYYFYSHALALFFAIYKRTLFSSVCLVYVCMCVCIYLYVSVSDAIYLLVLNNVRYYLLPTLPAPYYLVLPKIIIFNYSQAVTCGFSG